MSAPSKTPLHIPIAVADRAVFEAVYQKYASLVIRKISVMIGSSSIATEISQEVFIKLWTSGAHFETEGHLFSWLYRSANNAAIDYLRSAKYRKELATDNLAELEPSEPAMKFDGQAIRKETLRSLCHHLSERDSEIMCLAAFDEMTHEEIGLVLSISKKTVTRAILNARSILTKEVVLNEL